MPSIADLRAANPWADDVSDLELLNLRAEQVGVSLQDAAHAFGYDLPRSNTSANLKSGGHGYLANLGSLGAAVGIDGAQQFADSHRTQSELYDSLSTAPKTWDEVHGVSDFLGYTGRLGAQSLPYAAEFAATAGLGGLAMRGTRAAITAAQAAGDVGAATAARAALSRGATAAGVAGSYPSAVGDVLSNQYEQAGKYDLDYALAAGVPYAALNAVGIEGMATRGLTRGLGKGLTNSRLANAGIMGTVVGTSEGLSETGQEVFNQYGRNVVDASYDPMGDKAMEAYKESFIGGGLLGGIPGGAGGLMQRKLSAGSNLLTGETPSQDSVIVNPGAEVATQKWINQLTGVSRPKPVNTQSSFEAAMNAPTGQIGFDPITGQERPLTGADTLPTPVQAQQAGGKQAVELDPSITPQYIAAKYGVETVKDNGDGTGHWKYFGKDYFKQDAVDELVNKLAIKENEKPAPLRELEDALQQGGKPLAPARLNKLANEYFGTSLQNTAENLNTRIKSLADQGKGADHQELSRLASAYEALVGQEAPAYSATQNVSKTKQKTPVVNNTKQGTDATKSQQVATQTPQTTATQVTPATSDVNSLIQTGNEQKSFVGMLAAQGVELAPKQAAVVEYVENALRNNEADKVIDSEGVFKFAEIAKAMGVNRGSVAVPLNAIRDNIVKASGRSLEEIKAGLQARAAQTRSVEAADDTKLGLSPKQQSTKLEDDAVFGENASMQDINSIGGSVSDVGGKNEPLPESAKVETALDQAIDQKKAELAALQAKKAIDEILSRPSAKIAMADFEAIFDQPISVLTREETAEFVEAYDNALLEHEDFDAVEAALVKEFSDYVQAARGNESTGLQQSIGVSQQRDGQRALEVSSGTENAAQTTPEVRQLQAPVSGENKPAVSTPAETSKRTKRVVKTPESVWADLAAQYNLPQLTELHPEAQADWYMAKKHDLATANRVFEANKKYSEGEEPQFGKSQGKDNAPTNPYTAKELIDELKSFLRVDTLGRRVQVVDTPEDLHDIKDVVIGIAEERAFGWTRDGKAILIASRIQKGQGRAKFMHEVGTHLGLEGLLTKDLQSNLTDQITKWADANDGSLESKLARRAIERVGEANTADEDVHSEMLAYFVEEAMQNGIDPTATKADTALGRWFRTLWAAFKSAVRKLGMKPESITGQDIVDLAFGAAKLEVSGTWHGTAANFRKFDNRYMGSGEGAQAFGWGTYLAQKFGIAKEYWKDDVKRKSTTANSLYRRTVTFNGETFDLQTLRDEMRTTRSTDDPKLEERWWQIAALADTIYDGVEPAIAKLKEKLANNPGYDPHIRMIDFLEANKNKIKVSGLNSNTEGNLLRLDTAVPESQMFDWDAEVQKQSPEVKKALDEIKALIPEEVLDDIAYERNTDWSELTGQQLIGDGHRNIGILDQLLADGVITGGAKTKEAADAGNTHKAVSMLLEEHGVHGIKFYDRPSRAKVAMGKTNPERVQFTIDGAKRLLKTLEASLDTATNKAEIRDLQQAIKDQYKVLDQAREDLKAAKAYTPTRNLVVFDPKNIIRVASQVAADRERVKFGMDTTFRSAGGETGARVVDDTAHILKKGVGSLTFLHDLVARYKGQLKSVQTWYDSMQQHQVARVRREREAEAIASMADKLSDASYQKVNAFIGDSTFKQAWGYQPKWRNSVTLNPEMRARWKTLTASEQAVADAIFKHGFETQQAKFALLKKIGVPDLMVRPGKLDGPYAPLMRFGNFTAILKSQQLLNAEKAEDTKLVDQLKADPKHYQISMFDTIGQARGFVRKFGDGYAFSDSFENTERIDDQKTMDYKVLQKVMAYVKADKGMPSQARKAMEGFVADLYLNASAEHSARQQSRKRNYRAGYDTDMVRAFLTSARANASFMANLEYGEQINESMLKMRNETKSETGERVGQDAYNLFAQHYADNFTYKPTPFQDIAVGLTSAWQLSTSVGYHLTNASQGAMVTVPRLASDFNDYSGAWRHLMDGYKLFKQIAKGTTVDLSKVQNKNLRDALQYAADLGDLDVGMEENLGHFDRMRTGYKTLDTLSNIGSTALHKLRSVSRMVETMNRVSAGAAAYNMAIAHGKSIAQAKEYVISVLKTTQGDFTRAGAPLALKKLPKVMTQYRKFQLMMAALYVKAFNQAFHGATAEERAIGKRMLMFKLFHTSMAAGVLGWPMMNLAVLAYAALGGDDEPYDLETDLRAAIGDKMVADLLLRGPGAMLGLDMSAKLGEDKIFSIMPYNDFDFSSGKKAMQTVGALVAGPAGSQAGRFIDGFNYIGQGDYYKGIEKLMPKGASSAMESFRLANEGYTMRNGDVLVKPEDISEFGLLLNALGLPSTMLNDMKRENARHYEVTQFFEDRSGEIKHDFLKAFKDKDSAEMAELRKEWMDLQAAKDRQRKLLGGNREFLKRQDLSTLLMYPQRHAKAVKSKELNVKD